MKKYANRQKQSITTKQLWEYLILKIIAAKMKFDRMMDSCEDEEMRAVFRSYKKERDEDFSQNRQELAYASGDTGKRDGMIRMHPAFQ